MAEELDITATAMLKILALDSGATLCFSQHTGKWYVSSRLGTTNGWVRGGITEHRPTPQEAVLAFWVRLTDVCFMDEERIAIGDGDNRRHWYWNGAAFTEEPVNVLRSRVK
jgi:hypothetical protein